MLTSFQTPIKDYVGLEFLVAVCYMDCLCIPSIFEVTESRRVSKE